MTDPDIQFKRGSNIPYHDLVLYRPDAPDTRLPLAGAEVRLVARPRLTGATVIDKSLEILDPTAGRVRFVREVDEFATGEICRAEIVVTYGNGDILILPRTGQYKLVIEDSLI